jgi:DNA-binding transcriptional regulator/RsmH inhibitor MraZ
MAAGRPPSWNPVAGIYSLAWSEIVVLSSKDRMALPLALRRRLNWSSSTSLSVLAVLEMDGSAEILPWEQAGKQVVNAIEKALALTPEPHRAELALAAMDRYMRLTVDADGRTVLPTNLLSHLDALESSLVRLVARGNRMWFWSEARWREGQGSRFRDLADALADAEEPHLPRETDLPRETGG